MWKVLEALRLLSTRTGASARSLQRQSHSLIRGEVKVAEMVGIEVLTHHATVGAVSETWLD